MKKLFFLMVLLLIATLTFIPVLTGGTLMTSDDNIGHVAGYKSLLPAGFLSDTWVDSPLVGMPATASPLNWSNFWLSVLSSRGFTNSFHLLSLLAGSLALGAFLFRKGLSLAAVLLGVLAAFWLGSNLTLVYAGHIRKFSIVFLFCANLLCLDLLFEKKRWGWAAISGFLLGLMFLEQQDVALFFALFLGAYAIFLWLESGEKLRGILRLLPVPVIALLIAASALSSSFKQNISAAATSSVTSGEEQWEYCTQWSFPPDELIAFVAPGYTGWRSGEPDGPYWGRMGRSAGWEQTRQGFMNFKLEDTYLGVIPVAFALFALFACRQDPKRRTIYFWGGATLLALLLSFGKYTPLYRLFWQLPVIHEIRNPNKFLQVFQLGLAILTAFGADLFFKKISEKKSLAVSRFFWSLAGVSGLFVLLAISRGGDGTELLSIGWPQQTVEVIVRNKTVALWLAAGLAAALAFVVSIYKFQTLEKLRPYKKALAALLVAAVVLDAKLLSVHYVKTLPDSYIADNSTVSYLKKNLGDQRVAMVSQDGFYNLWLTYLFPYHQISAFNFTQMPRMAGDYKAFLEAVGRNPLRMWQLSGVGFLMGPSGVEKQLPADQCQPVLRYDVQAGSDGNFVVRQNEKGGQTIFRSLAPAPRYALIGGCEKMDDKAALAKLGSNSWKLFEKIILPLESTQPDPGGHGFCGTVEVLERRAGRVLLKVQADSPGFLRAANKYDPDWKAKVDGAPAEMLRADYIFQAVAVPAGVHQVKLNYSPENKLLWLQFAGMAICVVAGVALLFKRKPDR
ncbi:MAG: hypothetical protein HOO88_07865 [Kiritimatiellaceae bacterium]|nr:hypothetical protein [Kiritimatiellaceae bacterium]